MRRSLGNRDMHNGVAPHAATWSAPVFFGTTEAASSRAEKTEDGRMISPAAAGGGTSRQSALAQVAPALRCSGSTLPQHGEVEA